MIATRTKLIALISISLLLLSLAACGIFAVKVLAVKSVYESAYTEKITELARRESLQGLSEVLSETAEDRELLKRHVLTDDDVIHFLALIESLGRESGVMLSTDQLTVEPVNAQFEKLVATVSVEGGYDRVLHLLELMEVLPYEVTVDSLVIDQDAVSWRGAFRIQVLKFKKT